MSEDFFIVIEGLPQTISGKVVTQIGDPARQMSYTFIKGNDGGNYVKRKGKCSCCEEIQEDCIKFESWEELKEYTGEGWVFETVFNSMVGPPGGIH